MNGTLTTERTSDVRLSRRVKLEFGAPLAVIVFLMFPVIYWVAIPEGNLRIVIAVHVGVTVACALSLLALLRVRIRFTAEGVDEIGFFGRTLHLDRADVKSIVLNEIYREQGTEARTNLFALDSNKRVLLRMRGQFWSHAQMETVAAHLGVRIEVRPGRQTLSELRRSTPHWLYWFERQPWLRGRD